MYASNHASVIEMTGNEYIPMSPLGSGLYSEVWSALPADAIYDHFERHDPDCESGSESPSPRCPKTLDDCSDCLKDLHSKVCAVKIWKKGDEANGNEKFHRAMKVALRFENMDAPVPFRYSKMLEFNQVSDEDIFDSEECNWQATELIHGFDLLKLMDAAKTDEVLKPLPLPLVAHIAIQLHVALMWCHDELNPAEYHNDINEGNVMLDMDARDTLGLPKLALIDWESKVFVKEDRASQDRKRLATLIIKLASVNRPCWRYHHGKPDTSDQWCSHDPFWKEFLEALKAAHPIFHATFHERFYAKLVAIRNSMSSEDREDIQRLIDGAMALVPKVTDDDIRLAIGRLPKVPEEDDS